MAYGRQIDEENETVTGAYGEVSRRRETKQQHDAVVERYKGTPQWMKAPNGKPTKLNELQWVQVRTELFKKWFGDWENAAKYEAVINFRPITVTSDAMSRDEAESAYGKLKPVTNDRDKRIISFVNHAFGKIARHKEKDLIFRLVPELRDIVKSSIPIYSESERNPQKHNNIEQYHNYYAVVTIDGAQYSARFTTQELKDSRNELHNVFVSDIKITKAGSKDDISAISNAASNFPLASFDYKLQQWLEKVKADFDSASKAVDENGEPLVVYHGTKSSGFEFFNTWGSELGAHFGTKEQAKSFARGELAGEGVYSLYLSVKNPLRLEDRGQFDPMSIAAQLEDMGILSHQEADELYAWYQVDDLLEKGVEKIQEAIVSRGYDGVVYLNRREGSHDPFGPDGMTGEEIDNMSDADFMEEFPAAEDSWIVFSPDQIKSATGNIGTFGRDTDDIRFSTTPHNPRLVPLRCSGDLQRPGLRYRQALP